MKPPDRFPPDDPREWLNRARSNLALAKERGTGVYFEDVCFQAQQAAEKAIKALLIHRDVPFPYVHDMGRLLSLLEEAGDTIPDSVRRAQDLTDYATTHRYPGLAEPVLELEYVEAVEVAETVVRWVEGKL